MIFKTLLSMSVTGGFMIAAVCLVRPRLKRWRTHGALILLWLCALVLLLIPFRPASPVSLYNGARGLPTLTEVFTVGMEESSVSSNEEMLPQHAAVGKLLYNPFLIWLIGSCVFLLIALLSAWKLRCRFYLAAPYFNVTLPLAGFRRRIRVYTSPQCVSPVTYGVIRPRIILPSSMSDLDAQRLEHVLLHELYHIQNMDSLINLLYMVALCVHWFNPLVWIGWACLRRDMESRCDSLVIRRANADKRKAYAQTLLDMTPVRRESLLPLAFKSSVGGRIKQVLSYRPATRQGFCGAITVTVCILLLFATNPIRAALTEQIAAPITADIQQTSLTSTTVSTFNLYELNETYDSAGQLHQSFTLRGEFESLSDVTAYFSKEYAAQEVVNLTDTIVPQNFQKIGFGFGGNIEGSFSALCLEFELQNNGQSVDYMLIDVSTYQSDNLTAARALRILTRGIL